MRGIPLGTGFGARMSIGHNSTQILQPVQVCGSIISGREGADALGVISTGRSRKRVSAESSPTCSSGFTSMLILVVPRIVFFQVAGVVESKLTKNDVRAVMFERDPFVPVVRVVVGIVKPIKE